jgi:hypothetical protein
MPLPRTAKNRNQLAETWQRLASIRLSVPGYGYVTVADLLQQISASDGDPTIRKQLLRELDDLTALLAPLSPAAREEIAERERND